MASTTLILNKERLGEFCRHQPIRSLALFGSHLHGTANPESDLDLLVEFVPEQRIGLFTVAQIQLELTALLGRQVDLRTSSELSPYFRQTVLDEAEVVYAKGR